MINDYEKKKILVTGGSGFIGSNFILYFLSKYPNYHIINLDKLTYAATEGLIEEINRNENYTFIQGSIENRELVQHIFTTYDVKGVINFAAESHVDNSIANPEVFMTTNIMGTFHLLNIAYNYWMDGVEKIKPGYELSRFHHISTDEVYGALGEIGVFTENSNYAPNSPYSASKASSDLIIRSYYKTYGLNVVTTNCSNNYGPRQNKEKLIPTIIRSALAGSYIPVYGDGKNVRDWLHVHDHVTAIDLAFHEGISGETYNIGSNNEWSNIELVEKICNILDKKAEGRLNELELESFHQLIQLVEDRPGHDWRYAIDSTKFSRKTGWVPQIQFENGLSQTIDWYIAQNQTKILQGCVEKIG
ncbi:dTDP-glucose 4,6-dehydratase [Metabacillus fastidiosus]|uniref:dTDP-glucose 4,6-dehydratase n=1 Tax=Metabacillus fastidiosus TaxID=1458 RepID=UPI003D2C26BA